MKIYNHSSNVFYPIHDDYNNNNKLLISILEEADKVEVAPGVTVASLIRFRTALIGPTQGLPKRRRLCR